MPRHRSHSIEFKRQVAEEFVAGETLHGLAKRHDISRNPDPRLGRQVRGRCLRR
jgi:transposase-like protein